MTIDYTAHRSEYTVVYNANGDEIARLNGIVAIRPKNYEDQLPVQYRHIAITTEILNVVHIEKTTNQ